ncbi:MAG: hydrophobic/amphiphilic exporter (mainly bacteria), family [Acidobacteriota bacterium]|jgi:HAE1 family hydrophobic/amphiphilic exporter-1|nr:hydrophobic/amphiphilic exporter (mainly bacteria), family [Acidobacteriota bacterium]
MQKLAEICVRRPVFATVIILALTVIGGFSFFTLGVDRFPKIDIPTVSVSTTNPGAAPAEIESEITDVLEGAVNTATGIDELRSSSTTGRSQITISFDLSKDPDVATQEVRDKINTVLNRLPETADPPTVQKSDPDSTPILLYSMTGPYSILELTDMAQNQINKRIQSAYGVGDVFVFGSRQRQINVQLDPNRLRAYNLSAVDVSTALRTQNLELPGGRVNEGAKTVTLRTMSRVTKVDDFANIVITTKNGYPVKIGDVGKVEDGGVDPSSISSLNGGPAVTLGVRKQSGSNTIAVINAVKQRMAEIIPTLPKDLKFVIVRDQSEFIENSLHAIEEHLIIGGILASLVVFIFLWNFRSTIIAAVAIPTSIIAAFAFLAAFGYSLNQMTMLALTLMVGIVIDDAIVVLENIYRFVEEKGMHPFQAAIEGTREIGLAVLATTLSLLAVFLPVGFMGGIIGRFMSSFGLTAAAAIAVSLLVSFTLTPMLAARWIKARKETPHPAGPNDIPSPEPRVSHSEQALVGTDEAHHAELETRTSKLETLEAEREGRNSKESRFYRPIDRTYTWLLRWSMGHRWIIVVLCAVVIISIVPLYRLAGYNLLPEEDESTFQVTLRAPTGTSLAATQGILDHIARDIREKIPGVEATLAIAGFGQSGGTNSGQITVRLKPPDQRSLSQSDIIQRTRGVTKQYPKELVISAAPISSLSGAIGGGRGASAIAFFIAGPDLQKLDDYSKKIIDKIKQNRNVQDADRSLVLGNPEARIIIDRQRSADLGVKAGDIAQVLSTMVAGQRVTTYSEGSDQYDVVLMAQNQYRQNIDLLSGLSVPSSKGGTIQLSKVVRLEEGTSPTSIDRINRQRQVTVTASVSPTGSESEALQALQTAAAEIGMESGYTTGVTGQSKQLGQANYYFMLAFILSFIFMYLVLAAQFESFIHPVTILLTLPLSIPFALLSTFIAGQKLNIFSALGILVLFGIVKKNAILQISHTNDLRAHGMERHSAIIQANRDRLRPILMTTIALVAGMIPLIIGRGAGAATNRSIGVLVVGGQSLCLLLTLLAVPVFYSLFEDASESRVWAYVGNRYGTFASGVRGRFARGWTAFASRFSRTKPPPGKTQKDKYVDQASGD